MHDIIQKDQKKATHGGMGVFIDRGNRLRGLHSYPEPHESQRIQLKIAEISVIQLDHDTPHNHEYDVLSRKFGIVSQN